MIHDNAFILTSALGAPSVIWRVPSREVQPT